MIERFFFLTGHSMGGTIVNLMAAALNDDGRFDENNIFAYTFGSLGVTQVLGTLARRDANIFNILNTSDPARLVPLLLKHGKDIIVPMSFYLDPSANHSMLTYWGWMEDNELTP